MRQSDTAHELRSKDWTGIVQPVEIFPISILIFCRKKCRKYKNGEDSIFWAFSQYFFMKLLYEIIENWKGFVQKWNVIERVIHPYYKDPIQGDHVTQPLYIVRQSWKLDHCLICFIIGLPISSGIWILSSNRLGLYSSSSLINPLPKLLKMKCWKTMDQDIKCHPCKSKSKMIIKLSHSMVNQNFGCV